MGKHKDRFEFHVESVGIYKPQDIVIEALKKLKEKAHYWLEIIENQDNAEGGDDEAK